MSVFTVRDVTTVECPWLDADLPADSEVFPWRGHDYGCISPTGRAVSLVDGEHPFFELPRDAIGTFHVLELDQ